MPSSTIDNGAVTCFLVEALTTSQEVHASATPPLSRYLPPSHNGSIFVTTRTREVASKLAEESNIIAVEPIGEVHAVALLGRKQETMKDSNGIAKLAPALELMPLALII